MSETPQGYVDCGDCPRISTGCLGTCDKKRVATHAPMPVAERKIWHKPWCDAFNFPDKFCECGYKDRLAAISAPAQADEPVGWHYELALSRQDGEYVHWQERLTKQKPNVPEGSIRNLAPVVRARPVAEKEGNRKTAIGLLREWAAGPASEEDRINLAVLLAEHPEWYSQEAARQVDAEAELDALIKEHRPFAGSDNAETSFDRLSSFCRKQIRRTAASERVTQATADGQWVPREPTEAMYRASDGNCDAYGFNHATGKPALTYETIRGLWKAMLEAAKVRT